MTKSEINQLYWLNRENEKILKELESLREKSLGSSSQITNMPKGSRNTDKIAKHVSDIDNLERLIESNLQKIQSERYRLEQYINEIDNSRARLIFRLRHVNGLTWEVIGREIGYTYEGVRKIYLKEIEKLGTQ